MKKCIKVYGFLQVITEKGVRMEQSVALMGPDWGVGDTLPEMPKKWAFLLSSEINAGAIG